MSVDMNKTIADGSLDNLHDIFVPDALGFFPLAPGWIMVLLLLMALLFHFSAQLYKHYIKSQYRRNALKELDAYKQQSKENAIALLSLAKRVAIAAYGREEVAKLYDDTWWDFMAKYSKVKVSTRSSEEIKKLLYDESYTMNSVLQDDIIKFVTLWIKTHKVASDV